MEMETSVALTGNTYLAQSISGFRHPRFQQVAELLRKADVSLTNLECAVPDPDDPPAFVAGTGWAATYMIGTPRMIEDLKLLGIDGVCAANNHVSDFGDGGILSTIRHLREARMPFAGIGASLQEASEPVYIDTPTGLRLAYMAVCDWGPRGELGLNFPWPVGYYPSDDVPPFTARPGVNLLRYEAVAEVTPDQLAALRKISEDLDWERDKIHRRNGFWRSHPLVGMTTNLGVEKDSESEFWFLGRKFVAAGKPGQHTVACQEDLDRVYRYVREARRQADIVCVSLHDQSHGESDYITAFTHGCVDAGADVCFLNGGSHLGVEIYRGKAILYGVPSFMLQTEAVVRVPAPAMRRFSLPAESTAADFLDVRAESARKAFEEGGGLNRGLRASQTGSAIYVCIFDGQGRLTEIRIQPLEPIGGTIFAADRQAPLPRYRRGLPLLPEPGSPTIENVIQHVTAVSEPLGTAVELRDGVGVVAVA